MHVDTVLSTERVSRAVPTSIVVLYVGTALEILWPGEYRTVCETGKLWASGECEFWRPSGVLDCLGGLRLICIVGNGSGYPPESNG